MKGERYDVREITKTMSQLRDCRVRNIRLFDNSDARTCNGIKYDYHNDMFYNHKLSEEERQRQKNIYNPEPIHATSMTTFILRERNQEEIIEKIFSSGSVVVQRFGVEGPTYVTLANRTLHLVEKKDIAAVKAVQNPKLYEDLEFEWMEDEMKWDEPKSVEDLKKRRSVLANGYLLDENQENIVEMTKKKIQEHVEFMMTYMEPTVQREEAVKRLHENSLKQILPLLENLDFDNLVKLKQFYFAQSTDNDVSIAQRNIFLEVLPVTGTMPCALLIRDIISKDELRSDLETARLVASLPFHMRPIKTIVEEFYKLIQQRNAMAHLNLPLTRSALENAYAQMVRRTCVRKETEEECFKALHIEDFIRRFDQLSEDDIKNQKMMMMVFRNFQESEILERKLLAIIKKTDNKKYETEVRALAVVALAKRALEKRLETEYFLPIFLRRDEEHELRITAFDTLVKGKLSTATVNNIITHMIYDPDYELFNYVYTTFERLEKSYNEPCGTANRENARYFLKYWRQHRWQKPKYSFGLSKVYSNFFRNERHGYAGAVDVKMIGFHRTMTPLSFFIEARSQRYNHITMRDLGLWVRMEGIAPRIVDRLKTMTRLGEVKIDELKEILLKDLQIRQRDDIPAKFDIALVKGDNVVVCYHLEDREIMAFIEQIREKLMSLKNIQDVFRFNRHLSLTWDRLRLEMPTDFGVPMTYKKDGMTLIGLMGETKKETGLRAEMKLRLHWHTFNHEKMMTLHPNNRIKFAIRQDRVFKHQLVTAVRGEIDLMTRRLDLSLIVPEHESPLSLMGHSRVLLHTEENRLDRRQAMLKKSCPTCQLHLVVSKGKDKRRNVELLADYRRYLRIYGVDVGARLFDCEMKEALSPGQTFFNLLKAFNPLYKEPKNFFNILFSGLRQFRNYLFYFPRIESCGANLILGRAMTDPVREIKIVLDLKRWEVLERPRHLLRERTIAINSDIILRGAVDRVHKIDLEYKVEPTFADSRLDIDIRRQPFTLAGRTYEEYPIIINMRTKEAPKMESQFLIHSFMKKDLVNVQKYRVKTDTHILFGKPERKLSIEGEHSTTMEGIDHLRNTWYFKRCLEEHKLPEWTMVDQLPRTDACHFAIQDMFTLRQFTWDITATRLDPWMVNLYRKIGAVIKTTLFPWWRLDAEYTAHQINPSEPKIHIDTVFRPKNDMFDLTLRYDKDVSKFVGVEMGTLGIFREDRINGNFIHDLQNFWRLPLPFFHTSYLTPESVNYLFFNQHINFCAVTKENVRTYDNVTYPYTKEDDCWTLVTADGVENPLFAVFMKKDQRTERIALMMMVGNNRIDLIPVNDKDFRLFIKGKLFNFIFKTFISLSKLDY